MVQRSPTLATRLLAYTRLLRLSNAPTAVADVWMGYAVTVAALEPTLPLVLTSLVSLCLYHGGMALNDANDAERDSEENRDRPIVLGLILEKHARYLAYGLFACGLVVSLSTGVLLGINGGWAPLVACTLMVAIIIYNGKAKKTWRGPFWMGSCRFLNVCLGIVATGDQYLKPQDVGDPKRAAVAALCLGIYVVGLTWFARDEDQKKTRWSLVAGMLISLLSLTLASVWLWIRQTPEEATQLGWTTSWTVAAAFALRGMVAAILQPTPRNIGRGVGIAIQGLVVIDATLAALYAGPMAGLAIFALLPVTMLLSRWIPQT